MGGTTNEILFVIWTENDVEASFLLPKPTYH